MRTGVTGAVATAVAISHLSVFLRLQLNLIGRYLYLDLAFEAAQVSARAPAPPTAPRRVAPTRAPWASSCLATSVSCQQLAGPGRGRRRAAGAWLNLTIIVSHRTHTIPRARDLVLTHHLRVNCHIPYRVWSPYRSLRVPPDTH